jgi:metacaspase-1
MAKAMALLVGLKSVDPSAYGGWDGTSGCWGCELDVDNIERILVSLGYQSKVLKTAEATRDRILSGLYRAADTTTSGDIFVFYYSGHGGQQPDIDSDELDDKDETLVAFDREVIDDKIHEALQRFKTGVRVVMISDSCNSGSNYRGIRRVPLREDTIFRPIAKRQDKDINMKAQLIHLGGCRDGFSSSGYMSGGAFTMALCEVWQNGAFNGSFKDLHTRICEVINSTQKPQYNEYGPITDAFRNARAFAIPSIPPISGPTELSVIDLAPFQGNISKPGEKNIYRFTAKRAGQYVIETGGRSDLVMTLYGPDSDDKFITQDDDSGVGLNAKIEADLKEGNYYIRVQHYDAQIGTGSYSIKVTAQ